MDKPRPTDNVELLVSPYGIWEVDAVSEDGNILFLIDGPGTVICSNTQVRLIKR